MISFIYILVYDILGYSVIITEKSYSRELEKLLGCTRALSNVYTPIIIGNADGLDELCVLVKYAQRTGGLKLLVAIVL